jgi:hypothetical protein
MFSVIEAGYEIGVNQGARTNIVIIWAVINRGNSGDLGAWGLAESGSKAPLPKPTIAKLRIPLMENSVKTLGCEMVNKGRIGRNKLTFNH